MSTIRFRYYPKTEPPPDFVQQVITVFRSRENEIGTAHLDKGLTSNQLLGVLQADLMRLGFQVESGKRKTDKISRPVFFGENGEPTLRYEVDAYHPVWRCGLEVEAGRGWMGNAIYRDLVQAMVMVQVDTLVLAVANYYRYRSGGRNVQSHDYNNTVSVAEAIYGHSRFQLPYHLVVLGY